MFMANLVEDILDFSRMQFDKFDLLNSWFLITDVIEEIVDIVDFQL